MTIPGTYISGYGEWFSAPSKNTEQVIEEFCGDYQFLFDPRYISPHPLPCCGASPGLGMNLHKMGENADESIFVDREIFRKHLIDSLKPDQRVTADQFFIAIHRAYALSRNLDWDNIEYIVFALHSADPLRAKFLKNFNTRIISVIREPIQSAFSLYKHYLSRNTDRIDIGLTGILSTIRAFSPIPGFELCSKAIKLEHLHTQPEITLENICNWLSLNWNPVLLKSTFNGKLWHNLEGTDNVRGFNTTIISKRHEDLLTEADRVRLETHFRFLYKSWDYPLTLTKPSFLGTLAILARFKIERDLSLTALIKNRLFIVKSLILNIAWIRRVCGKRPITIIPLLYK